MLGHTKVSWDDESGEVLQPRAASKFWFQLTDNERAAAVILGYTEKTWDDKSGNEAQPASYYRFWDEMTKCGEDFCYHLCWIRAA